jgi:hypothetical protein
MIDLYGGKDPRDIPTYRVSEAARYLRIPIGTVRSWVAGRRYRTQQFQIQKFCGLKCRAFVPVAPL